MSSTGQKWLLGCGIGCGVVILLGVLLIGGGIYFARGLGKSFERAAETGALLSDRFGEASGYTPPLDGAVPPARMEAFLTVRDSLALDGKQLARALADLERVEHEGKRDFLAVLRAVRGGTGMVPLLGEFLHRRNRVLASQEMGLGEYTYIYALAYYGLLGKRVEDGPKAIDYDDDEQGRDIRPRLRRQLLAMLHNLLSAVETAGSQQVAWRDSLRAEIAAIEADADRMPWQDGLPPRIAASFEPYRERLEATYEPMTNIFEFMRIDRRGKRADVDIRFGD